MSAARKPLRFVAVGLANTAIDFGLLFGLRALGVPMSAPLTDRDWICGTPMALDAVARLRELRLSLETGR